jgi:hypothetical protein
MINVENVSLHAIERGVGAMGHETFERGSAFIKFKLPSGKDYDAALAVVEDWMKPFDSQEEAAQFGNTASGAFVKEVKLGMTFADVQAALGLPTTKVDLAEKVLYKYKDMTVEFHDGKVSDVKRLPLPEPGHIIGNNMPNQVDSNRSAFCGTGGTSVPGPPQEGKARGSRRRDYEPQRRAIERGSAGRAPVPARSVHPAPLVFPTIPVTIRICAVSLLRCSSQRACLPPMTAGPLMAAMPAARVIRRLNKSPARMLPS